MAGPADRIVERAPYVLLAAVLAWVAVHAWGPLHDPDAWWHLRLGEDLLHQHSLSAPDHWSAYATVPWVPSEPLPEIAVALVHNWLGLPGVVWLYVATVLVVVSAVYLVCRLYAAPLPAVVATSLFVAVGEGSLTPRPQLVSYLLLLLVVEAWRRTEADLRPRVWLVPLSWFWSLCHGFWFIGVGYGVLAVVAIALGRKASRGQLVRLAAVAFGAGLVVLLNPIGIDVFEAPFRVSSTAPYVTEWQHPSVLSGPPLAATAMALVVAVVWLVRRPTVTWFTALMLLSAVVWDWYALRTMVLGGLLAAPLLAGALHALMPEETSEPARGLPRRERGTLAAGLVVALLVVAAVVPTTADRPGQVPTGLDAQLDRLPAGTRVFNDYALGGWLTWRHPDLNQYIDGLITPYSPTHVRGYHLTQVLDPGWYAVVRDSQAPVALLSTDSTLAIALQRRGWTSSGSSDGYLLLHRPRGSG